MTLPDWKMHVLSRYCGEYPSRNSGRVIRRRPSAKAPKISPLTLPAWGISVRTRYRSIWLSAVTGLSLTTGNPSGCWKRRIRTGALRNSLQAAFNLTITEPMPDGIATVRHFLCEDTEVCLMLLSPANACQNTPSCFFINSFAF